MTTPGTDREGERDGLTPALADDLAARCAGAPAELADLYRHALLPPGKLLRPLLVAESAAAVGGSPGQVLPAASAVELLHVGTLVHDDIIDGDTVRRGRAAVHYRFGSHRAVVGGDALFFQAFDALAECARRGVPADRIVRACAALATAGRDLCRGVTRELDQAGTPRLALGAYLEMAGLKTSPLFGGACRIGAVLAGADDGPAAALGAYGHALGIAFQARDDLLAYEAPPETTGKPAASDLDNHRPTLPVLLAHQRGTAQERMVVEALLAQGGRSPAAHARMRRILARTGALDAAGEVIDAHVERCHRALAELPTGPAVARLAALADRLRRRPGAAPGDA
ncbi:polyprenyl synthetase family protein [Streptomyces sp. B1866]|uniref:polyprenyl synthetase family protein n=1 Tax=Streptomyces sp. B1866 TaxID=3075431 RepID=UPI00288DB00A|nr:polyprenyl synthetase family protein [Streptomyces sp. B1866]MDT3399532.1 polyprenyl synthetase family protein [Streptomyces sp. B1866]